MSFRSYNGTLVIPGIKMWVDGDHPAMRWYEHGAMPRGTIQAIIAGRELPTEVDE